MSVHKPRASALGTLFGRSKAIIGVIHSRPLPGSPAYDGEPMDAIYDYAVREGSRYAAGGKIFADVHVKHGAHAIDSATREEIAAIKGATELPVVVGSGVTEANVGEILSLCDGVIVASSLKRDGVWWNEVDPARVRRFMDRARAA